MELGDGLNSLVGSGLGLLTASDGAKQSNVLESATFKPPPSVKKDPGGIGFIDDVGDGVNGLMSCTESLGFESCDERRTDDDEIDDLCSTSISSSSTSTNTTTVKNDWRRNSRERKAAKKFPPPLSSSNNNGRRSYFLRPQRKNGRLEVVEVRVERPAILRASREDGRLRLHLIQEGDEDEDDKVEEQRGKQELEDSGRQEGDGGNGHRTGGEWRFPETGERFMRCYDEVAAHHHRRHNLHVESALCEHKVEQIFVN